MRKTAAEAADSGTRSIPSMERILSSAAFAPLIDTFSRAAVKDALTRHLAQLRSARDAYDESAALQRAGEMLSAAASSSLRHIINATGIIIHTNLGRSPIDASIWAAAQDVVRGYSNLEFDLAGGERGARDEHLTALCQSLFGCEAAILTNNNAAGTLLLLAALAAKKEVIVSRGELVEIGGAFRVPDVIQQGGAKLHEVGTTNRTRAKDYAEAVTKKTAAILKVHRSNFDIVGFTETPSIDDLVAVARVKRIPLLYDEGSGRVVDLTKYGFAAAPTVRDLIASGVDVVTCSTDKLIGATQGGLILGRAGIIDRCRRHPLMRALRAGKESYAVIAETLRAFATEKHEERVAIYRLLATPLEELRARAVELTRGTNARIVDSKCALGGGTTPTETIPSIAVEVSGDPPALHARFLANDPPIVGRIQHDAFRLEVRTMIDGDVEHVKRALHDV
jgi:L-seryl-tRNA(Ser) seleniumtransferase